MRYLPLVLLLCACDGDVTTQCPGFGNYQAEGDAACVDPTSAIDLLRTAGELNFNPADQNVTIEDVYAWDVPFKGKVTGLTTLTNVYVDRGAYSLAHELLHVHERPGNNPDHVGWHDNGFYALDNFYRWLRGQNSAIGQTEECARPLMPAEMRGKLESAGYGAQLDAWEQGIFVNEDCQP